MEHIQLLMVEHEKTSKNSDAQSNVEIETHFPQSHYISTEELKKKVMAKSLSLSPSRSLVRSVGDLTKANMLVTTACGAAVSWLSSTAASGASEASIKTLSFDFFEFWTTRLVWRRRPPSLADAETGAATLLLSSHS